MKILSIVLIMVSLIYLFKYYGMPQVQNGLLSSISSSILVGIVFYYLGQSIHTAILSTIFLSGLSLAVGFGISRVIYGSNKD
jgi:hypothetical protein